MWQGKKDNINKRTFVNMLGNRRSKAFLGLILNAMLAAFMVYLTVKYIGWADLSIRSEKRMMYDEELLRIYSYGLLPLSAALMILSASLFWMLRKNER